MIQNLNFGPRLLLLTTLLSAFMIAIGIIGLHGMARTLDGLESVYMVRTIPVIDLGKIQHLSEMNVTEILRGLQHNPEGELSKLHDHPLSEHLGRIDGNLKTMDELWRKYRTAALSTEEIRLADDFGQQRAKYNRGVLLPAMQSLRAGDFSTESVNRFLKGNRAQGKATSETLVKLIALQTQATADEFANATANYQRTRSLSIISLIGAVTLGLLLAWKTIRSITKPLHKMRATITAVEETGDFTHRIALVGTDEACQTAKSFDDLMASLQATLRQVLHSTDDVSRSAQALSTAAGQVAASSSQQSEAASAMAATVEEVTASIHHISDSANEALDISQKSDELSSQGSAVIHQAAAEMAHIAETVRHTSEAIEELGLRSNKISAIVQVIREVADQTNLLALNAAIEAARAGEQGRGFAVVADEVRMLAERTSKATGDITQMIAAMQNSAQEAVTAMGEAVAKVGDGAALAQQAGDTINQIKHGADQVVDVVNNISAALKQQNTASQDISSHVEKVAQMSEKNSAAAGASADAAQQLEELACTLRTSVARFKI